MKVAKPFSVPADGPDVFWNFLLPSAVGEIRYVKAIEIRPGQRAQRSSRQSVARPRPVQPPPREDSRRGISGNGPHTRDRDLHPDSHFLFWKPGGAPRIEPDGMAWRLDPGNDLVLNVHFHPTGKPELAQPSIGLYFTDKPQSKFPMLVQIERDRALNIAPGMRDFLVSDDFRLPLDVDAIAVYPHAHYLGTLLEGYATLPDGSRRWLIRIPRWDINWQAVYRYRQPLFLPKGAVISMRFHYDNSAENPRNPNAPPKPVVGGNQSTDEMGHLWLQVLPRGGDQRAVLQEALMRHRLENDPANFSAHFNLGVLLLGRKDASSAITHLRESLRLEPEQPLAVNDLGAALELEGRVEDALEQFRSALRLQPDYTNARFNLANGLAAQGKLEEAAANFRQALTTVPEDRAAREQLVAVLIRTGNEAATEGRLSAAAASYRELVTLRPGDADLRNNLGIILARSGDFASAAEQFEAALKANPSHQTARRNLKLVRDKLAQH